MIRYRGSREYLRYVERAGSKERFRERTWLRDDELLLLSLFIKPSYFALKRESYKNREYGVLRLTKIFEEFK